MKRIIFFVMLISLVSCYQQKKKPDGTISQDALDNVVKSEQGLQSIIQANINRKPTIDTIFLGFS
ncbi:MAG: hypothetical protein JO080_01050, partial [Mucilaginibacter sp.]|nr:hypothetical protein [Mucilaginibacter sp.]